MYTNNRLKIQTLLWPAGEALGHKLVFPITNIMPYIFVMVDKVVGVVSW